MADEEADVCEVVERAMADISEATPMELLLSDSSRANLAASPQPVAGAPGCRSNRPSPASPCAGATPSSSSPASD